MADAIKAAAAASREPAPGDYFMLPFKGKRRDLLIQAVEPFGSTGQWKVRRASTGELMSGYVLLSSCTRISTEFAARILGVPVRDSQTLPATGTVR